MPRLIRNYLLNSSFHGYRYIAQQPALHLTERLFWFVICLSAWICAILLIFSALDDFQSNSISFVVDTSHLEWNTQFPSIAVCETDNQQNIATVTDETFGDPHDYNLDEIVKELVYFRGLSFYTLQICGPDAQTQPNENCWKKNFSDYSRLVRGQCSDIFKRCRWNEEDWFECCKYFYEIDTELGTCYAINSLQTKKQSKKRRKPMVSNRRLGPGNLYLELKGVANVYLLGEQEVPSMTTLATDLIQVSPGIYYHRYFAVKEIENEREVQDVSIAQRKCKFTSEGGDYLQVYPHYSYSACCVQCRKNAQLAICGCVHHLIPKADPARFCNITGLDCLSRNYERLSVLKPYWAQRAGLVCDCLPSCTEIELSIIKEDKIGIEGNYAIVELSLERLPTERFKRNVVRGKLDLVVSMGGSTALFLGASLLSFVEFGYYFVVRVLSDRLCKRREI